MIELVKKLFPYLRPNLSYAITSLILSIPLAAIKAYQAKLAKNVFDDVLIADATFYGALKLALILLSLALVNYPCRFFHFYLIRYVVDKASCRLRTQVYEKLQKLPLKFFTASKQGTLISHMMNDTQTLALGFRNSVDLIREPLYALSLLGVAIYMDWQLTLIVFLVFPLFLVIFQESGKRVRRHQEDVQEEMAEMTHNIGEGIHGQKVIKAFNLQHFVIHRFNLSQSKYFKALMKTTKVEENAHPLVEFVGALAFAGVILFAHYRIKSGAITTGDFVSFVTALALFMDPIRKFSQANVKLNQARAAGDRLFSILDQQEEVDQGQTAIKGLSSELKVEGVSFSYGESKVLHNLSFELKKGQKLALVGPSGSGKSTFIHLLLGLYPLQQGSIRVDGVELQSLTLKSLRGLFGYVGQETFLFNDTVRNNLTLGQEYSEEQIRKALEVAVASDFVNELENGLDTYIGDRGTRLSGGQCQRLCLARAFLQDNPILLFDEATSALDNESEKLVQKAIERVSGQRTVLAIAHRLSTIQDFDQIIYLRSGKILEKGRHEELLSLQGEYAKLYQLGLT